jgi:hypothetical protein
MRAPNPGVIEMLGGQSARMHASTTMSRFNLLLRLG